MNKVLLALLLICICSAGLQAYYSFSTTTYNDDTSYFLLREAEHINTHHEAFRTDSLTANGRAVIGSAVPWYIIAFLYSILGIVGLKIFSVLVFFFIPISVYFLAAQLVKEEKYALLAAASAAWIPIIWQELTNSLNMIGVFIPIALIHLHYYLKLNSRQEHLLPFVLLSFLLAILHPISLLIAISLVIWIILSYVEGFEIETIRKEAAFFFVLITFFIQFYLYRTTLVSSGFQSIYQNIPQELLKTYFANINVLILILSIGIPSIIFGLYGILQAVRKPNEASTLLSAFALTFILLLVFKLIPFTIGLVFLSILLALLSAIGYESLFRYIFLTKFSKGSTPVYAGAIVLIVITLTLPAIFAGSTTVAHAPTDAQLYMYDYIKTSTPEHTIVLTAYDEANQFTFYANRSVILNNDFIGINDANQRYKDIVTLYRTQSTVEAIATTSTYDLDYLYLSPSTQARYNITKLPYSISSRCYIDIYHLQDGGILYENTC